MFSILKSAKRPRPPHLITVFAHWLQGEYPRPFDGLGHLDFEKIRVMRNREDHADPRPITAPEARAMATSCRDVISALHPTRYNGKE